MNTRLISFNDKIHQIRELINRSKYNEALDEMEQFQKTFSDQNQRESILILIEKARVYDYSGKFDKCQDMINQILEFKDYENDIEIQIRNNALTARLKWKLGDYDKSQALIVKALELLNNWEESREQKLIVEGHLYNTYGNVLNPITSFDEALFYLRKSLIIWEKLGDQINAALALNNIGNCYYDNGQYNLALLYLIKHLNIVKSLNHIKFTAVALNNVGEIYRIRGDLEKSLDYIKQSLILKEKIGDKLSMIYTLQNIALIENNQGEGEKAMEHLKTGLEYAKELGNPIMIAELLFSLIHVNDHNNSKDENQKLILELEKLATQHPMPGIVTHAKLGKALILKSQKRLKNIIEAEEILEEVVNGEIAVHNLLIFALKHLCEIYLVELKITGKEQVMHDINEIVDRLYEIGLKNNLYQTLIEALILKSKIAMVNSDFSDTIKFLNEAEELALSRKLTTILKFIKEEKELFQSEITKWTELLERNQDMSSRVELVKLASYLRDVQQFLST